MSLCLCHTTAVRLAPCSGGDGPPPWFGSYQLRARCLRLWGRHLEHFASYLVPPCGRRNSWQQISALTSLLPCPCSHIPATKAPKTRVEMGKDVVQGSLFYQLARRLPKDPVSVCLSVSIPLALPYSLSTSRRYEGRAELSWAL